MNRGFVLALLSALVALSACSTPTAPTAAPGSIQQVGISTISPALGTALSTGTTAAISLTVVSFVASPAHVTISLRNQARVALPASAPSVDIAAPGEASLRAAFVVPAQASSIEMLADFRFADQNQPGLVVSVQYSVR